SGLRPEESEELAPRIPRPEPRPAAPAVVADGDRRLHHASCVGEHGGEQLHVRGPPLAFEDRATVLRLQQTLEHDDPVRPEPGERVARALGPVPASEHEPERPSGPAHAPRRLRPAVLHRGRNHVRAAFDPLDERRDLVRLFGEVGLEHDDGVAARVRRAPDRLPEQELDRRGVPLPLVVPVDGQREDPLVRLQDFGRRVRRSVIDDEDLVIPLELRHDLPDLPEHHPDRTLLVVRRNADIDQGRSGWFGFIACAAGALPCPGVIPDASGAGSSGGRVFHRRWCQRYWSGAARTAASSPAVNAAVSRRTTSSASPSRSTTTSSSRTRYLPSRARSATPRNSGAPVRSARSAGPRCVEASRPKNGTKTPARRASWSATKARTRPWRSERSPSRVARPRSMTRIPSRSRASTIARSKSGFACRCATTSIAIPRAASDAPPISQFPMWPVTRTSPRPRSSAARNASSPSISVRARTFARSSEERRSSASPSRPRCAYAAAAVAWTHASSRPGNACRMWDSTTRRRIPSPW